MIASIVYNLRHLMSFSGRDGRRVFWSYFLFVVLLNILIVLAVTIPTLLAVISDAGSVVDISNSEAVEAAALDSMMQQELPGTLVRTGLALGLLNIVLLSAAIVRRSHDSALPGMVLLIPLALQLVWMYFSYGQLRGLSSTLRDAVETTQAGGAPEVQAGMIAQDLIGWLVVLIVAGIGMIKSQYIARPDSEANANPKPD